MQFEEALKHHRQERGLSQVQLANRSGLTPAHVSKIEAGKFPGITLVTVGKLAAGLGLTLCELLQDVQIETAARK